MVVKGLVCYEDPGKYVDQDFILVEDYFVYWINQIRGADYYVAHVLIDFFGHLGPSHNQATSDTIHTSWRYCLDVPGSMHRNLFISFTYLI